MKTKTPFLIAALIAVLNLTPVGHVTAQTFTTLHSFTATAYNDNPYHHISANSDGANPSAGLIESGNTLYGTARNGGSSGYGTVFAVNTDGTSFGILHNFLSPRFEPCAGPLDCLRSAGCGFTCVPGGGNNYCRRTSACGAGISDTLGAYPQAGLTISGGTLYGAAAGDGKADWGTVFAVFARTDFRNLYGFLGFSDGAFPIGGLIVSGNTLYGTARDGGSSGGGTVFTLNTDNMGFTNLHSFTALNQTYFTNSDGVEPSAALILLGNTLYGTASYGGSSGNGTVFAVNTDGTGFTNLHSFTATSTNSSGVYTNSDGAIPQAALILLGNTLYGTATGGGTSGSGTVFALNTDGTAFTNLHSFTASDPNTGVNSDGANPTAGLVLSGNTLYGTASAGGSSSNGTVFALNTDGTAFTTLHSFTMGSTNSSGIYTNTDGAYPSAGLILSGNTLYGTASAGGTSGNGTVFSLSFRPQLTITRSRTNVILSWPISSAGFSYAGYILQETANLGSPDAWVPSDAFPPVIVNGQVRLTARMIGPQRFYRLRKD